MSTMLVLSLDAAWGGLGWAIGTAKGPIASGVARPTGTWRWARLDLILEALIRRTEEVAEAMREQGVDVEIVMVVEWPGTHHTNKTGKNDRVKLRALAAIVGACLLMGYRDGWAYPWAIEPNEWRVEFGWRGGERETLKKYARLLVASKWPHLAAMSRADKGADQCEAILLGWAACTARYIERPQGPTRPPTLDLGEWTAGGG